MARKNLTALINSKQLPGMRPQYLALVSAANKAKPFLVLLAMLLMAGCSREGDHTDGLTVAPVTIRTEEEQPQVTLYIDQFGVIYNSRNWQGKGVLVHVEILSNEFPVERIDLLPGGSFGSRTFSKAFKGLELEQEAKRLRLREKALQKLTPEERKAIQQ